MKRLLASRYWAVWGFAVRKKSGWSGAKWVSMSSWKAGPLVWNINDCILLFCLWPIPLPFLFFHSLCLLVLPPPSFFSLPPLVYLCYVFWALINSLVCWPWRGKFSCWDSNPQPFNQESGTLTTELSLFPVSTLTMAMLQSRPSSRTWCMGWVTGCGCPTPHCSARSCAGSTRCSTTSLTLTMSAPASTASAELSPMVGASGFTSWTNLLAVTDHQTHVIQFKDCSYNVAGNFPVDDAFPP